MHRTRTRSCDSFAFDPEIERTLRQLRKDKQATSSTTDMAYQDPNVDNEVQKSLRDFAVPMVDDIHTSITRSTIQANNFKIK